MSRMLERKPYQKPIPSNPLSLQQGFFYTVGSDGLLKASGDKIDDNENYKIISHGDGSL